MYERLKQVPIAKIFVEAPKESRVPSGVPILTWAVAISSVANQNQSWVSSINLTELSEQIEFVEKAETWNIKFLWNLGFSGRVKEGFRSDWGKNSIMKKRGGKQEQIICQTENTVRECNI